MGMTIDEKLQKKEQLKQLLGKYVIQLSDHKVTLLGRRIDVKNEVEPLFLLPGEEWAEFEQSGIQHVSIEFSIIDETQWKKFSEKLRERIKKMSALMEPK